MREEMRIDRGFEPTSQLPEWGRLAQIEKSRPPAPASIGRRAFRPAPRQRSRKAQIKKRCSTLTLDAGLRFFVIQAPAKTTNAAR